MADVYIKCCDKHVLINEYLDSRGEVHDYICCTQGYYRSHVVRTTQVAILKRRCRDSAGGWICNNNNNNNNKSKNNNNHADHIRTFNQMSQCTPSYTQVVTINIHTRVASKSRHVANVALHTQLS